MHICPLEIAALATLIPLAKPLLKAIRGYFQI